MTDWQTGLHAGWVKDTLFGRLAECLTDSLTGWLIYRLKDWLTAWLTDYVPGHKAFPHVLLHAAFQLGNAASSLHSVYSVEPSRGSAAPLHLHTRPENASPMAAINQQQRLSLSLARLSFFSLLYAHRHAGWGHFERVNRCWLICPGLSDIARVMYLMWSLFSSNKRIKN